MYQRDQHSVEMFAESEERFQAVWQAASDAMVLSRADGTVFAANPAYYALYGYTPEEVLGKDFSIIFPPAQREWAQKLYTYVFKGPTAHSTFEASILRPDGSERFVEACYSFIERDGVRTAMLSVIRDITERKRVEEALRDSKLKLHLALELAHLATWEWDIVSNKVCWSANLEIALGFAPGTFGGRFEDFLRIIHPEDRHRVEQEIRRALVEGIDYEIEFRSLGADGTIYWSTNRGQVIYDDEGKPTRMLGVSMAIPESQRTASTE